MVSKYNRNCYVANAERDMRRSKMWNAVLYILGLCMFLLPMFLGAFLDSTGGQ